MRVAVDLTQVRFRAVDRRAGSVPAEEARRIVGQRLAGHQGVGLRPADSPAEAAALLSMRGKPQPVSVNPIEEIKAPSGSVFDLGLLFDTTSNMVAMAGEVTIGQVRQFSEEAGYRPKSGSPNADQFSKLVANGDAFTPMVFTNEVDCLRFIEWALFKAKAQDPRLETLGLPSDEQWLTMRRVFKGQLTGLLKERLSDNFFRSLLNENRTKPYNPRMRHYSHAFRLVGTYKKD